MLITNPIFSLLQMYVDEYNKQLLDNKEVDCNYKCYDKDNDFYVLFALFDLKADIKNPSGLVLSQIVYDGDLVFDYHKSTNEVYIRKVPFLEFRNGKIAVLTSDLIKIIIDRVKKYSDEEIVIKLDDKLPLVAIDKEAINLIPSLSNSKHYVLLKKIIDRIHKEEEDVIWKTKKYKMQRDNTDRKIEFAASKKRSIYGIDPNSYHDYNEFRKMATDKLVEVWGKKISNINRHLCANERKYKDLIKGYYDDLYTEKSYTSEEIEEHLQTLLEKDLKPDGILRDIEEVREQYTHSRYKVFSSDEDTFYLLLEDELGYHSEHINYFHTSLGYGNRHREKWHYTSEFKTMVDLLIQISELRKQLNFYQQLIENPNDAVTNFSNSFFTFSALNQLPCWFRIDWNKYYEKRYLHRENLLMIHPDVKDIKLDDMQVFAKTSSLAKNKTEEMKLLQDIKDNKEKYFDCDELTITIPKTLSMDSIEKIIKFSQTYCPRQVFIICESVDSSVYIKRKIFLEALSALKNKTPLPSLNYNICIFPNYYNFFLVNTPSNGFVYHEYASHLPNNYFAFNLESQFMSAFQFVNEYFNGDLIILGELLLGDYSSQSKEYFNTLRIFLMNKNKSHECKKRILKLSQHELVDELYKSSIDQLLPF